MPDDLVGLGVGLTLKGTPWCGLTEAGFPLLGARTANASGEPIVLFPSKLLGARTTVARGELPILVTSELVILVLCCTSLVNFESFARGLGVPAADLSTLFFPELPMAGFNSPRLRSFLGMLGLDCEIFELTSLVVVFFSQVAAFSGGFFRLWLTGGGVVISLVSWTSGLAGVCTFLKINNLEVCSVVLKCPMDLSLINIIIVTWQELD